MGVQLKQNADASAGLQGTDLDDGGFVVVTMNWSAITNTSGAFLTVSGPVLNRRMIVKAITYVNDTTASNAVTATIKKAASGTALGSGTTLHSGTANLQATAATNTSLTLSTTASDLDCAAGTRLGFVISATPGAAGVGSFTVTLAPA
jgi:hypothetical protein